MTHMEVHVLSNRIKHKEWRTRIKKLDRIEKLATEPNRINGNQVENRNVNGRKMKENTRKLSYRMEIEEKEEEHL